MKRTIAILLLCVLAGAAPAAAPPQEQDYALLEAIAGEPVKEVRFFRVRWFRPLDNRSLVLWLGREEPYLVDLREYCYGLDRELSLAVSDFSRPGRNLLRTRWSRILLRDGRDCRVRQIRPLDYEALMQLDARFHPPAARKEEPAAEPAGED